MQASKLITLGSFKSSTSSYTTGAVTFESEEVLLPGSSIIDIDDLTSLQTQVAADPGAVLPPVLTLSGADAASVRFNAAGDLVDGPLRFVDKDEFVLMSNI